MTAASSSTDQQSEVAQTKGIDTHAIVGGQAGLVGHRARTDGG